MMPANALRGEGYTIYPYARGPLYPPDTLYMLYRSIVSDKAFGRVFYEAKYPDVQTAITYFNDAAVYLAVADDDETLLGAVWFTARTDTKSQIGIWYRRATRGPQTVQISKQVVRFAADLYHWETVWGLSPWKDVMRHGLACDFAHVATVPGFVTTSRGYRLPLYVMRWEKGEPDASHSR